MSDFEKAKDAFGQYHWGQGAMYDGEKVCMAGALRYAIWGEDFYNVYDYDLECEEIYDEYPESTARYLAALEPLAKTIKEQYPEQFGEHSLAWPEQIIIKFNDSEERKEEEVLAIFEKVIAKEAEHGLDR